MGHLWYNFDFVAVSFTVCRLFFFLFLLEDLEDASITLKGKVLAVKDRGV